MDKKKEKRTEEQTKRICELQGVVCGKCGSLKLFIIEISYFKNGQIILRLFCDSCGTQNFFPLFQEEGEPTEDITAVSLKRLEEKNKQKKNKNEKK